MNILKTSAKHDWTASQQTAVAIYLEIWCSNNGLYLTFASNAIPLNLESKYT